MPAKQFVLATYDDTEYAQKVLANLTDAGFERKEMHIWYRQEGDDAPQALLRVRVAADQVQHAIDVMNSHPPGLVDTRTEWSDDDWGDLIDEPHAFETVALE